MRFTHGRFITLKDGGGGWLLECTTSFHEINCDRPTGMWRLLSSSATEIKAQWKANEGASVITVELHPAAEQGDGAWSKLLGDGPRRSSPAMQRNAIGYSVLTDLRSGVKVPQLIHGLSGNIITRFNDARLDELRNGAAARLENLSYDGGETDDDAVRYVSARWLTGRVEAVATTAAPIPLGILGHHL